MKTRLLTLLFVVLLGFAACNHPYDKVAAAPVADSLLKPWVDAWNAADVEKISACIDTDAILIMPEIFMTGTDSISKNWVVPSSAAIHNLKVLKLNEVISGEMATISGSYTHDWVRKDSVVDHVKGFYSFVWRKKTDNLWKLAVINLN